MPKVLPRKIVPLLTSYIEAGREEPLALKMQTANACLSCGSKTIRKTIRVEAVFLNAWVWEDSELASHVLKLMVLLTTRVGREHDTARLQCAGLAKRRKHCLHSVQLLKETTALLQ